MGVRVTRSSVPSSIGTDTVETADIQDNAVTLAKMAGITRGSIIYGNASGDPAALAKGTNTYVLTSNGTDIAWAVPRSASDTVVGASELATVAEINTSTDTGRTMTPGAFSDSIYGITYVQVAVVAPGSDIAEGAGKAYVAIPPSLNGMNLVDVQAEVVTAGDGSAVDVDLYRIRKSGSGWASAVVMTDPGVSIEDGEVSSSTHSGTEFTIAGGADDVATSDLIRIDVIGNGGDTTIAKGLIVTMGFRI